MVSTVSSSGIPTIQIRNVTDSVDMLTTKITIDATEFTSYTATTPAVIDATHDDVATGDRIASDLSLTNVNSTNFGFAQKFDHRTSGMTIRYYDTQATIYYYTPTAPDVTTGAESSKTTTGVTMSGNITEDGYYTTDGSCTRRGFCYKLETSAGDPTTSDSISYADGTFYNEDFNVTLSGLTASANYKVRPYAVNSQGTSYGNTVIVELTKTFVPKIIIS